MSTGLVDTATRLYVEGGGTIPRGHRTLLRSVNADFTSSREFRWPFPGAVAVAAAPIKEHKGPCPSVPGDGLCLGKTWRGVASGGIPATVLLLCSFRAQDVLGEDADKIRVRRARVLDVFLFAKLTAAASEEERANLRSADLRWADLSSANLFSANLRSADLRSADLRSADLRWADLSSADLGSADLRSADLRWADLSSANLFSANLRSADLRSANLRWADLRSADLRSADLSWANLRWANLRSADLRSANLFSADLSSANLSSANLRWAVGVSAADRKRAAT